ncbi:NirD/YgiW/YdeI family stress tolerance protein [Pseudodesulfovibrio indicus]|uniref:NirD/YgiW/YdeI family stress tolerance protein n=1 Tax=Pseudodesulfovibrio indicus TaxID=1716143 RepID=UPI00292E277C|nr:NirD/YgiW/YdeI family stress tolerance protein [Pseudodesulfovibrio indicus]
MKRFSLALMLVVSLFVATAFAASAESFTAHSVKVQTVADAKVSAVDTGVVLSGKVVKIINDHEFLFSDSTGELLVLTNGQKLDQALLTGPVDITGQIVQDFMYTQVKADSITAHN